ncbi:MAG: methyltransferase family protein [Gammaproteobacteria bacterium]
MSLVNLRHAFVNIALCLIWGVFAYSHYVAYMKSHQLSLLRFVFSESLVAVMFLLRNTDARVSKNPFDWMVALAGTFTALFFRPSDHAIDPTLGACLILAGVSIQIAGVLSLNRSFGIVPANRGIKTNGMYRLVRHPIYFSYLFTFAGYQLSNFSPYNLMLCAIAISFLVARIVSEERHLRLDDTYHQYMQRVRWRLFPYVF